MSKKEISKFIPEGCTEDLFKQMLRSISINTLVVVSNNEDDLTETVKRETISLLMGASFYLSNNVETIYRELWTYVFDISKKSLEIKYTDIINMFKNFGALKIDSNEWLKFPIINDFKGRNNECDEIMSLIENYNKIVLCGISGIGKSYIMSNVAQKLKQEGVDVCWLSLRANMTFDKMLNIFGAFFEKQMKTCNFYEQLKSNEIGNQIQMLNNAFTQNKCIVFIDSFEIAENNVHYLLSELFKNMRNTDFTRVVISTTDSTNLYNQIDLAIKDVYEYTINEFTYEDLKDFYSELQLSKEDFKMIFDAVGGFPVANSLIKKYLGKNPLSNLDLAELLHLTSEEKNKWLFNKIYINLSDEEKNLLTYLSTLGYGFGDYEIYIIEKDMQSKLKYTFTSLTNKKLVLFDGDVYYLHGVMKKLIYEMLLEEKNIVYIGYLFQLMREDY
ncbi:ATP-binding protein [Tissierella praeacuta]|uniref:ATP-binding protein n=1 Tax=Tissierella praeacuta TaxID=43131 RepID=UPI0028A0C619|nr:ATP-binding protein [Tissierella praeacuta]